MVYNNTVWTVLINHSPAGGGEEGGGGVLPGRPSLEPPYRWPAPPAGCQPGVS